MPKVRSREIAANRAGSVVGAAGDAATLVVGERSEVEDPAEVEVPVSAPVPPLPRHQRAATGTAEIAPATSSRRRV